MVNKMNGESVDLTAQNIARLKELFPEILTDGEKIDFDMLKTVLGDEVDSENERYQFTWHGKKKMIIGTQKPSKGTLRPDKEKSKNFDTTENLYIEGDNLEVLKLLQKSYNNKIDLIYIDPPYNTGQDFIYTDNYDDSLLNYLEKTGQIDSDGNYLSTNSDSEGRYHTNWLNMIYSRLKVAKNLLTDSGMIFISIDDNELPNLIKVGNEVFGERNFVNCIAVKMSEASGKKMMHANKKFPKLKEYILIYKKNQINLNPIKIKKEKWDTEYNQFLVNFTIQDREFIKSLEEKEVNNTEDLLAVDKILEKVYSISVDEALKQFDVEEDKETWLKANAYRIFRTASSTSVKTLVDEKKISNKNLFFSVLSTRDKKIYIAKTSYSEDSKSPRVQVLFADNYLEYTLGDFWSDISTTGLEFEGEVDYKNGKKPVKLIRRILQSSKNKNAKILDFFAGSSTTAHAVLQQNAIDGGKRKFIMVQLPENLDESLNHAKDDESKKQIKNSIQFLDSINKPHILSELGIERIRRAGDKIKAELIEKQQKPGMLDGNVVDPESLDIGFKVLKLDTSNIREWNVDFEDLEGKLDLYDTPFVEDRSELDVVYEIMLKQGLELTYPIETFDVNGQTVYDIAFGSLFICLSKKITTDIAKAIIARRDEHDTDTSSVIFSDAGFATDSDKLNCIEILKDAGYPEDNLLTL